LGFTVCSAPRPYKKKKPKQEQADKRIQPQTWCYGLGAVNTSLLCEAVAPKPVVLQVKELLHPQGQMAGVCLWFLPTFCCV